ncbi:Soluble guanylate cyclase gcy [Fasciola gigantica]|uniref:Soluble guanylate cyclase gcy n=1 Tax=Fasciola gigantica TaxID=46835 RepID=A0A504Y5P0_FASGI|nr:Soluble guanylate cyclase gcy [Fasciola gigantica]
MSVIRTIRMVTDHSVPAVFRSCLLWRQFATHLSTQSSPVSESGDACAGASRSDDDGSNANIVYETPGQLAAFLSERVVAVNEHFVLIDKPAGLSVWGHSLSKREAMLILQNKSHPISIKDCLPELAKLLDPHWTEASLAASSHTVFRHRQDSPLEPKTELTSVPSLNIAEPLPAEYSGLVLLARTAEYAKFAEKFYRAASRAKPPWYLYQRFLAVCRGQPTRSMAQVEQFPVASFSLNNYLSCGYRPAPNELSRTSRRKGLILHKYISHELLATNRADISLVCLEANSTYRGLPELYLLHEGCTVIGELIQSSRLVDTGVGKVVLHPSQVNLGDRRSMTKRDSRPTLTDAYSGPVHLHRASLLIPIPLAGKSSKTPDFFRASVPDPRGCIQPPISGLSALKWLRLSDPTSPNSDAARYALFCVSPSLPVYFERIMHDSGLVFNYAAWIDSCENTSFV